VLALNPATLFVFPARLIHRQHSMASHWQQSESEKRRSAQTQLALQSVLVRSPTKSRFAAGGLDPENDQAIIPAAVPEIARMCQIVTYRVPRPMLGCARFQRGFASLRGHRIVAGPNPTWQGQQPLDTRPSLHVPGAHPGYKTILCGLDDTSR
jgi:hypothetical protein